MTMTLMMAWCNIRTGTFHLGRTLGDGITPTIDRQSVNVCTRLAGQEPATRQLLGDAAQNGWCPDDVDWWSCQLSWPFHAGMARVQRRALINDA
jgi:hypothetical protein